MEYRDQENKIQSMFFEEFMSSNMTYGKFILSKDLGIYYLVDGFGGYTYKIVDEKKWVLARLKYGL
jgi:hypothetical protein